MSSKYYHTQRQSSSIKGLLTPLGGWDSHFSRHQPIIPSREPSPFKVIFPKNRWSWKLFFIALKPYPSFGGQESFLILQESQKPLFQQGRIPSSLLDIPRSVPLYYISYLLGSVCGVDFLLGYLFFLSTPDMANTKLEDSVYNPLYNLPIGGFLSNYLSHPFWNPPPRGIIHFILCIWRF